MLLSETDMKALSYQLLWMQIPSYPITYYCQHFILQEMRSVSVSRDLSPISSKIFPQTAFLTLCGWTKVSQHRCVNTISLA